MALKRKQEDSVDYTKALRKEITEHVRLLQGSLLKVRQINVEAELTTIKNNICFKLCNHCKQKVLFLSRNQLNCDDAVKQNEVITHPLTEEDDIDMYKHEIEILKYRIKKKDQKLRSVELKSKSTITTDSSSDTDLQESIDILTDELGETIRDVFKLQNEKEEYLKQIKQLNSTVDELKREAVKNEKNGHGGDKSIVKTKGHTAQKQGDESLSEYVRKDMAREGWDVVSRTEARSGVQESQDQRELTNPEIHEPQQKLERFTQELNEKQKEIDEVRTANRQHVTDVSELKAEKQALHEKLDTANEEIASLKESLQQEINKLTGELDEKKNEIDQVRKERDQYVTGVANLRRENKTLQEKLQQETTNFIEELEKKKTHIERIENKNERYVGDISELQEEGRTLKDGRNSLARQNEEMAANIKDLQTDIDKLTGELSEKDEEINNLRFELKECQRLKKKTVVMRLVKNSRSGLGKAMVDMVNKELDRRLGKLFDSPNFDFSIVLSETPKDASQGPLFVLCLNMSRVGTNIQDALEGMKGNRDVYVLVLHHTNKENLPQLTPTSLRVTGSEVRQLGGIIDMAFSSDSGLYDCDLNNNAVDKIMTALKRY